MLMNIVFYLVGVITGAVSVVIVALWYDDTH